MLENDLFKLEYRRKQLQFTQWLQKSLFYEMKIVFFHDFIEIEVCKGRKV